MVVKELFEWYLECFFFSGVTVWPVSSPAVDHSALQAPCNMLPDDRYNITSRSFQCAMNMSSALDGQQLNIDHQMKLERAPCAFAYVNFSDRWSSGYPDSGPNSQHGNLTFVDLEWESHEIRNGEMWDDESEQQMHRDGSAENTKGNSTNVHQLGWHAEGGLWLENGEP
jgi:hypothetical protein